MALELVSSSHVERRASRVSVVDQILGNGCDGCLLECRDRRDAVSSRSRRKRTSRVAAHVPLKPALAKALSTISRAAAVASRRSPFRPATIAADVAASRADVARLVRWRNHDHRRGSPELASSNRAATRARARAADRSHSSVSCRSVPLRRSVMSGPRYRPPSRTGLLRPRCGEALVEDRERRVDLVGGRDQRRDDPDDVRVGPGGQDDEVALERLGLDPLGQVRDRASGRRRRPA